jgi:transcriptional regulator with GAF, ATPase, and Fis domain
MNGLATNRSDLLDSRVTYLKILALSLLREIASVEKMDEREDSCTFDLQAEVRRFETELIRSALIQTGGRQRPAARLLGTKVTTLNTKIKRYKIKISDDLQIIGVMNGKEF